MAGRAILPWGQMETQPDGTPGKGGANQPIRLTRRSLAAISLAAGAAFSTVSWLIHVVLRGQSFASLLPMPQSEDWARVPLGLLLGGVMSIVPLLLFLRGEVLGEFRAYLEELFHEIRPTTWDLVLVSAVAGFSEELLFRSALQPLLGVWLAAVLFAAVHVGAPRSREAGVLGGFIFLMGVLLGWLYQREGVAFVMLVHASYDAVFLLVLRRWFLMRPLDKAPLTEGAPAPKHTGTIPRP